MLERSNERQLSDSEIANSAVIISDLLHFLYCTFEMYSAIRQPSRKCVL